MFSLHIDTARTWRGGQNQALLTVSGLLEIGQRAALLAQPDGELRRRAEGRVEVIPLAPRAEADLPRAWRLAQLLGQLEPDVIHAHDAHAVAMGALALTLRRSGQPIPLIASRRVDFPLKGNAFSRWKHRQIDCFIAASDAIRHILLNDGVAADRVATIYEGIDIAQVLAAPLVNVHEALGLPQTAALVANVAALVPHKGQRHLVDAARLVSMARPDVRFVIFGEGPLGSALERQIRETGLEGRVILAGFRVDVIGCLKGCDLAVMSSVTEGLGTSLLDAMACSRAVVASRVGGIAEIVSDGQTGRLVPPRDHAAMAQAILTLLADDDERRRLGAAGLARVRAEFTVERMVAETAALYARVVDRRRAADRPSPPEAG